jgi:hypothetical protein
LLASFGSNSISTSGNITAGYVIGNGSALTSITGANITGTVANATFATSAGTATTATTAGTVTTNAQPNITSVGTLSSLTVTGNIGTGGILTDGYYYANGTPVSFGGGGSPGGSDGQIQYNDGGAFGGNVAMTFDDATGNITLGNIVVELDQQVQTVAAYSGNSSVRNPGQITVGNGYDGNITNTTYLTVSTRGARLLSYDKYIKTDNGARNTQLGSLSIADLNTGNLANGASRVIGVTSDLYVTNGNVTNNPNQVRGYNLNLNAGQGANWQKLAHP